jgi:hypothetical protein
VTTATHGSSLVNAPIVLVVAPELTAAVDLAVAHARARLTLPPFTLVWRSRPGAPKGEGHFYDAGAIEVCVNHASDLAPRDVAWVVLHELRHLADGRVFCAQWPQETENNANSFAASVMAEAPDLNQLDGRRPSGRR